jgi:hypothetical protein
MKNLFNFKNCKVTINKQNIVFVYLKEGFIIILIYELIELTKLQLFVLESLFEVFLLEMLHNLLENWLNELLNLFC